MNVYITDIKTPFASETAAEFQRLGWTVLSPTEAEAADAIDMLICTEDAQCEKDCFGLRDGIDAETVMDMVRRNDVTPIKTFERLLPLLEKGTTKRVCMIADASRASICHNHNTDGYGYSLSKVAFMQSIPLPNRHSDREQKDDYAAHCLQTRQA